MGVERRKPTDQKQAKPSERKTTIPGNPLAVPLGKGGRNEKTMNKDELRNELKKADQKAAKNWEKIKALKAEIETAKKTYYAVIDGKPFTEWKESAYLKSWSDKEEALDQLKKIAVILSSNCRYFVEEIVKISLAEQLQKYAEKNLIEIIWGVPQLQARLISNVYRCLHDMSYRRYQEEVC